MDSKKTKDKIKNNIKGQIYPLIPTRDVIVLEGLTDYVEVGRERSKKSVAMANKAFGKRMVLIPQKNPEQKEITSIEELNDYGILVEISNVDVIGNNIRITVKGLEKVEIMSFNDDSEKGDAYIASFKTIKTSNVAKKSEKLDKNLSTIYDAISHKFFLKNSNFQKVFFRLPAFGTKVE